MFLGNPVDRTNTHYRIMLFRGGKVETFDHTSTFKNDSVNKMLHVINTERFTIKVQKIVNVRVSNATSNTINLVGVPRNPD